MRVTEINFNGLLVELILGSFWIEGSSWICKAFWQYLWLNPQIFCFLAFVVLGCDLRLFCLALSALDAWLARLQKRGKPSDGNWCDIKVTEKFPSMVHNFNLYVVNFLFPKLSLGCSKGIYCAALVFQEA